MFDDVSAHLTPLLPAGVVAAIAVALIVAVAWSARVLRTKLIPGRWVAILAGLRLLAVALLILGLLQPMLSFTHTVHPKPELAVVIDTSRSMSLPDGDGTRLKRAASVLLEGAFADHLRKNFQVRTFAGSSSAAPLDAEGLAALDPTGGTTRLGDLLRTTVEQTRTEGAGIRRVLLLSDGVDHGTADPAASAANLGVPVDVLAVGTAGAGDTTLSIADAQAASRVLVGSETRFLAIVRGDSQGAERKLTLHLAEDGREIQTLPVVIPANRNETRFELTHRPEAPGVKRYTLRISGPGAATGEFPVNVQVLDRTYEALILEDTWRWEFKYLRRALEDDPSFRFTAVLARGPAAVMQFGSPDRRAPLVGMPQNAADVAPFDLFMIGDVNPVRWPRGLASSIARAVTEEGKSLIVVAGPNLGKLASNPDLNALLPVEINTESGLPTEGPIEIRPANESAATGFFFDAPRGKDAFPPLDRIYAPIRKRPAATVLLESSRLANSYGPLIVMAEQTVGRGRVLYLGTDTLWKWQTLVTGDGQVTPHRAFWQQALRALAPIRPAGDGSVWLLPDRTRVEVGQPVNVWAVARGSAATGSLSVTATMPDDRRLPLATSTDPLESGRWRTTFAPTQPGTYRVTAAVRVDGKPAGEATTTLEVSADGGETADTIPDAESLDRIARASGGKKINAADPTTWPTAEGEDSVVKRETLELWNDGLLLVLLTLVLGFDWLLRLLRGYV